MIELSDAAIKHIQTFSSENKEETKDKKFRIYVEGGGCSGFQSGFTYDPVQADDEQFTFDSGNLTVLVDSMSLNFLEGALVDYVDDLRGAGFLVKNPNATATCSCGMSFAV